MTESTLPTIERALLALAAMDPDHAGLRNDEGFNGRDTGFGNSLAQQIKTGRTLTPRQKYAAHRMLATYREQLARYGIDYAAIPEPARPEVAISDGRSVHVDERLESFLVRFEFNAEIGAALKALPDSRRWNPDLRAWLVEWSDDNIVGLATIVRRYAFSTTPAATELLARADALAEAQKEYAEELVKESIAAAADYEVAGLGAELYAFQKAGVQYATKQRRTFIADEMGLGKTVQALATVQALGAYPCVVICPASLKGNWKREAHKWLPGRRISILTGRAPSQTVEMNLLFSLETSADVIVVNYDVLGSWVPTLRARAPKAVIFDESHYIKTSGAARTKAARELAKQLDCVLMLTGTPVLNRPQELMTQLTVMDRLRELGGYNEFKKRYVDAWQPNLTELNEKLRALCYIRRTKEQVLTELPPKQRSIVPIELDNWSEYIASEGEMVRELIERHRDLEKARQQKLAEDLVSIEKLKQLAARGMMAGMIEWTEDFLESGEKLIEFGWHRAVVREMAERFGADFITGDTPLVERDRIVDAFQKDPKKRLIVGNIQAMGVGITLTAASTVNMMELGWNMATMQQAEDRAHRIGQQDSVNANYFIGVGTIYERIWKLLEAKNAVVTAATEGRIANVSSILPELIADLTGGRVPANKEEVPA